MDNQNHQFDNDRFQIAVLQGDTKTIQSIVTQYNFTHVQQNVERGRSQPWWIKNPENGDTALHVAIRNGYQDIAMLLLEEADPLLATCDNIKHESPLYLATKNRSYDVVKAIIHLGVGNYSVSGPKGRNPLHAAVKAASISACKYLFLKRPEFLKQPDIKGMTPLHLAVDDEQKEVVQKLLELEEKLESHTGSVKENTDAASVPDNNGLTPLLIAATKGYYQIIETIIAHSPKSALVCDLNNGRNVIHLVEGMRCHKLRKFLKLKNVNEMINKQDSFGNTPLHLSIIKGDKDKAIALLEVKELDWKIKNNEKKTPMDLVKALETAAKMKVILEKKDSEEAASQKEDFIKIVVNKVLANGNQDSTTLHTKEKAKQDSPEELSSKQLLDDQTLEQNKLTPMHMHLIRHAIEIRESVLHPLSLDSKWGPSFKRINLQKESLATREPEDMKKIMDGVTLVATLVVTLTFAAAFTVPGGYDQNTGSILLIKRRSLKVFFYSDSIAMLLCILIMLDYAWAFTTIRRQELANKVFRQTMALSFALLCTVIAFLSGLYAVAPRHHRLLMHTITAVTVIFMALLLFLHPLHLLFIQFPINLSCTGIPIILMGPLTRVGVTSFYHFREEKTKYYLSKKEI